LNQKTVKYVAVQTHTYNNGALTCEIARRTQLTFWNFSLSANKLSPASKFNCICRRRYVWRRQECIRISLKTL